MREDKNQLQPLNFQLDFGKADGLFTGRSVHVEFEYFNVVSICAPSSYQSVEMEKFRLGEWCEVSKIFAKKSKVTLKNL